MPTSSYLTEERDYTITPNPIENGGGWIVCFTIDGCEVGQERVTIPNRELLTDEQIRAWQGWMYEDALAIATGWLISDEPVHQAMVAR